MASVTVSTCRIHPEREGVALCPRCRGSFCRECVTEHDYRLLCKACMQIETGGPAVRRKFPALPARLAALSMGLVCVYLIFYLFGNILSNIPPGYHAGYFIP